MERKLLPAAPRRAPSRRGVLARIGGQPETTAPAPERCSPGRRRERTRSRRRRNRVPSVALTGYTNTGKSALLNRLTGADVLVEDALFATLDPTVRRSRTADVGRSTPPPWSTSGSASAADRKRW